MKVFIINLASDLEKRNKIRKQCETYRLNFEFFEAIDGNKLSDKFIENNVYDFSNSFLTKGEVGCALSHYNIYKKIVEDNLAYALILEDDALLDEKLPNFLHSFETQNSKKGIFLLTADFHYLVNRSYELDNFEIVKVTKAVRANGYIITNDAAKKLINFLLPIRYEADMFKIFRLCANIKLYATLPYLISSSDKNLLNSSLHTDRAPVIKQRSDYRKKLFKKDKKRRVIALWFWKHFISWSEKTNYYID